MNALFGLRGTIVPAAAVEGLRDSFKDGSFEISIENGVIEIGFADESLTEDARATVKRYLDASSFARDRKLSADLNMGWRPNAQGGRDIQISIHESVHVTAELQGITTTAMISGRASIVHADIRNLSQQADFVKKISKNPALASAIQYFSEEVVVDDKPLYGIYKALEALTGALGKDGRTALGKLAGQGKKYVDDVMQTAQTTRHHDDPNARQLLTDAECKERARALIAAYAKTVS